MTTTEPTSQNCITYSVNLTAPKSPARNSVNKARRGTLRVLIMKNFEFCFG